MKKLLFLFGILFFYVIPMNSQTQSTSFLPLEDFFKNAERYSYKISPDGKHFAFLAPYNSRMNIFIQRIGDSEIRRLSSETERDIKDYIWGNNNRILFIKDTGGDENYKLFGIDIDGNNFKGLTDFEGIRTNLIDELVEVEKEVIIGMNKRNKQIIDPYRLNIETGELTILAENPGNINGWMTDNVGKLRIALVVDGINQTILYRETEEDEFSLLITTNFKESLMPISFTNDNTQFYATSNINKDKTSLVLYDPQINKEIETLYENDTYDISSAGFSVKDKRLLSVMYQAHDGVKRHFFDKEIEKTFTKISEKIENVPFGITSRSRNEKMMIIRTYNDKTPGTYFIYDVDQDYLLKIGEIYPWLNEAQMATMHCVEYITRDNLKIEAYLTLPNGYTLSNAKNLPVIVNPHGGPWARNSWGFNPEVQFLANRGYVVFQLNFRGSTGYGRKFWEASFKQWGRTMQDDITDGVNWLITEGIADSDRIAIYGGSYGGYATLAGLSFTPDLYAAGIDYVGISNIFTFLKTIPSYWKPMLDMMYEMVGDPEKDKDLLESVSPVMHVDKMKAPLFIAQGANDPRVNKDESEQMVKALKERGVEVEYLLKENEGHGFHNEENRFEFYQKMESFLLKHIGK